MGVCRELKKADIPCRVEQIPNKHYHILVSPNALDLARKAANLESIDKTSDTIPSSDADEEEVFDPTAELLDAGVPLTAESRRRDTSIRGIPKMLLSRCGRRTSMTFPPSLNCLWMPTTFIGAAIPKSAAPRKSSSGLRTNHLHESYPGNHRRYSSRVARAGRRSWY